MSIKMTLIVCSKCGEDKCPHWAITDHSPPTFACRYYVKCNGCKNAPVSDIEVTDASGIKFLMCSTCKNKVHFSFGGFNDYDRFNLTEKGPCKTCNGQGKIETFKFEKCTNCFGTGGIKNVAPCDLCEGDGLIVDGKIT